MRRDVFRLLPLGRRAMAAAFVPLVCGVVLAILAGVLAGPRANAMTAVPFTKLISENSGKCLTAGSGGAGWYLGSVIGQSECRPGTTTQGWMVLPGGAANAYILKSQATGGCLEVLGTAAAPGKSVVLGACKQGQALQLWQIAPAKGGGYSLVTAQGGYCLDLFGHDQTNAAFAQVWACNGGANQHWQFEAPAFTGNAPLILMNANSGQCAGTGPDATPNQTTIGQWTCSGQPGVTWKIAPSGGGVAGVVQFVAAGSGLCLAVSNASMAGNAAIGNSACNGQANQLWQLRADTTGWRLVSLNSGLCLSVMAPIGSVGSSLSQAPCASAGNNPEQVWTFHVPVLPGVWAAPVPTLSIPVAAANLPNGNLLTWASDSGFDYSFNQTTTVTEILNIATGGDSEMTVTNTSHNMFCPGIANLADGRILVNGGVTLANTSIYDPATNKWSADAQMNVPRGYESSVLNADGSVFTMGGSWPGGASDPHRDRLAEVWRPGSGWTLIPAMTNLPALTADYAPYRRDNHMWLHVMSGGRMLQAGPSVAMNWVNPAVNGTLTSAGVRGNDTDSMAGTASAYDVDKLLKADGGKNYDSGYANTYAAIIDASHPGNPVVTQVAPMTYARSFANSVVLPNGQVVILGGQTTPRPFTDVNSVLVPEIWDPVTQVFSQLPAAQTPRNYHSVALLLQDGRVVSAGGGLCLSCDGGSDNHASYEILTPPYLLNANGSAATRPSITAVTATGGAVVPGGQLTVTTSVPVKGFALMRLSSTTHTVNNDQRRIPLPATTDDGQSYSATLPSDFGVLVAGYYWLFAIDSNGVPSIGYTLLVS